MEKRYISKCDLDCPFGRQTSHRIVSLNLNKVSETSVLIEHMSECQYGDILMQMGLQTCHVVRAW